jgi:hypothetical protein
MALHAAAGMSAEWVEGDRWKVNPTRLEIAKILLDHGANVNEMDEDPKGRENKRPRTSWAGTPLHRAVDTGSLELVQYLLDHGADPLHPSWMGHTALVTAEIGHRQDVIDVLTI